MPAFFLRAFIEILSLAAFVAFIAMLAAR